ncbi:MAG: hypothetical protein PUE08_05375 [Eubacteriales bacterium]|nr:hypothetical protein [Eubacteriales bacterium]
MANFSESDINEAKRRVREMQSRANRYVENEPKGNFTPPPVNNHSEKSTNNTGKKQNSQGSSNGEKGPGGIFDFLGGDDSQIIILILILILSHEGADNKLIMALLYLLL